MLRVVTLTRNIPSKLQSLAAQSAYFDRLFFGNYMEKTMKEIPIGEVKYKVSNVTAQNIVPIGDCVKQRNFQEFFNIMLLLYGSDTAHFHCLLNS